MKKNFSSGLAWAAIIVVAAGPGLLWLTLAPLGMRFGSWPGAARSLGQLTGLTGMALFAIAMILVARLAVFDRWFDGLDKAYVGHHLLGGLAFILLLAHPLFLAARYLSVSARAAFAFLLPWMSAPGTVGGFIGLGLMLALLGVTFYGHLRYDWWKWTHKFLGVAYLFGFYHMMVIESDTSSSLLLKGYLVVLSALAGTAWLYRSVLGPWVGQRRSYQVAWLREVGSNIWEVGLRPLGRSLDHEAGQFAYLSFRHGGVSREEHPFTIASAPGEPTLRFVIKNLGDWTSLLYQLTVGVVVSVAGPFGSFRPWRLAARPQVWLAGGIGVTPFLSAARAWPKTGVAGVDFYYCVRDEGQAVFFEEMKGAAAAHPELHWHLHCGPMDLPVVSRDLADLKGREFFLCGPPAMMDKLVSQLVAAGVRRGQIHREIFNLKD